uniref:Kelch like family member 10 n=1 Tax=Takifugu rubripes TaxID=31033 RepID=H2V3E4_TAKRU
MSESLYSKSCDNSFTDAIIKVGHAEFQIHKIILSKCSRYFQALFTTWSAPDKNVYEIRDLSPDVTRLIIFYAYTSTVPVTSTNAMELLLAADRYNVLGIVEVCCDFLMEMLSTENCIGIWQFSDICYCSQLQEKAFEFILCNFDQVISSKEFHQLSVEELCDIFDHDELNVKNESIVFEAICKWISHNSERRKRHFAILLPKVRLALLSLEYIITNMVTSELMNNNAECWEMVLSSLQLKMQMATSIPPLITTGDTVAHPRVPKDILLAIGGWIYEDVLDVIEAYNVRIQCWVSIPHHLNRPRAYHSSVFLNESVYCLGGYDEQENFSSMCRFDLNTCTWHEVAPMHYRRCYASVTVLDGYIYALGGYDGTSRQKSAERYTPDTNQWSLITPMHEKRSDASCTTLNNKIYICGGYDGEESVQTGEFYDPETNQWTMIASMGTQRSGHGVVAYVGHIYAVGGFDGREHLKSAEAYNPQTDSWNPVPNMLTARSNFGYEVIENRVFVVGGFSGFRSICSAECYDADAKRWFEVEEMETPRFGLSCCLISGFPDLTRNLYRFYFHLLHKKEDKHISQTYWLTLMLDY